MLIELYRHGATPGNARGCYIGRTDEALSESGRAALDVADETLSQVYVTPLLRTRQTARLLFPNAAQMVIDDLREMDFGIFEGKNYREMEDDARYRAWVASDCEDRCPEGERRDGFSARVCTAFEGIVDDALRAGEKRIVFVVHGGTIMSVLAAYAMPHRPYFDWQTGSGMHWTVETDASAWAERRLKVIESADDRSDNGVVRASRRTDDAVQEDGSVAEGTKAC